MVQKLSGRVGVRLKQDRFHLKVSRTRLAHTGRLSDRFFTSQRKYLRRQRHFSPNSLKSTTKDTDYGKGKCPNQLLIAVAGKKGVH